LSLLISLLRHTLKVCLAPRFRRSSFCLVLTTCIEMQTYYLRLNFREPVWDDDENMTASLYSFYHQRPRQGSISVYVLVAIVRKRIKTDQCLYTILQILSITLLEKQPIIQTVMSADPSSRNKYLANQLFLFE
jgi:hypothetical protein